MNTYTVFLYRSGRLWVLKGEHRASQDTQPPLVVEQVEARTELAAVGKVMLQLHDKANQPFQHICTPCELPHLPLYEDGE